MSASAELRPGTTLGLVAHAEEASASRESDGSKARDYASLHRRRLIRLCLISADVLSLSLVFVVTQGSLWFKGFRLESSVAGKDVAMVAACAAILFVLANLYGLYARDERRLDHTTLDELGHIFHFVTVGSVILFFGLSLTGAGFRDPFSFWLLAFGLVFSARMVVRLALRNQSAMRERLAILGVGETADFIVQKLHLVNRRDLEIVGFFANRPRRQQSSIDDVPILGTPKTLIDLIEEGRIDRVIVAQPAGLGSESASLLRTLSRLNVRVDLVPASFEAVGPSADLYEIRGIRLLSLKERIGKPSKASLKWGTDIVLAACGLVLLSPLLIGIALVIKLTSRGPVLYRGERIGRNGTRFGQLKFRTMKLEFCRGPRYGGSAADAAFAEIMSDPARRAEFELNRKLEVDPRITPVGRFLRRTSLDELPSLVNVVKGDLSLVGPRTVTVNEFEEQPGVDPSTGLRPYWELTDVRPGITGYAVVNGRSRLSYRERVRLDMAYASNRSTKLDLFILIRTLKVLLSREGAA